MGVSLRLCTGGDVMSGDYITVRRDQFLDQHVPAQEALAFLQSNAGEDEVEVVRELSRDENAGNINVEHVSMKELVTEVHGGEL